MRGPASVVALLLALAACRDGAPPAPAPPPSAAAAPDPAATARRPPFRYYLGRTASRCEIYRVDEQGVGKPLVTPCPQGLEVGERIRIAGKTCFRDSSVADRVEPVICPDPLTNKEKADLGEL